MKLDQNVVLDVAPAISYNYEKTKGQGHLASYCIIHIMRVVLYQFGMALMTKFSYS